LPFKDPEKQKAAARRWYERNREVHKQRCKDRIKANWEAHLAYKREYRRTRGRSDRPNYSDAERLHRYKPVQRWLETPKLSPSVAELIVQAQEIWRNEQEKRRLQIIYSREKTRRYKAKLKQVLVVQVPQKKIREQFKLFGDCCAYCGKSESDEMLHIDHFIAVSKGGTHVLENLVPACKSCNFSKRNHHPEDWYRRQVFFSEKRWRHILRVLKKKVNTVDQLSFL
jgi:5-methylcytosine-specific restriction endonuclease McrA